MLCGASAFFIGETPGRLVTFCRKWVPLPSNLDRSERPKETQRLKRKHSGERRDHATQSWSDHAWHVVTTGDGWCEEDVHIEGSTGHFAISIHHPHILWPLLKTIPDFPGCTKNAKNAAQVVSGIQESPGKPPALFWAVKHE